MLIFLDFDGVMHPTYAVHSERFSRLPMLEQWLRERPAVHVVISSSWRMANTLDALRTLFSVDLQPRVVGCTPPGPDATATREQQIRSWLDSEPNDRAWVAIDDVEWLFAGTKRLVLCDPHRGLQREDLDEVDRLLALPAEPRRLGTPSPVRPRALSALPPRPPSTDTSALPDGGLSSDWTNELD